MVGPCTVCIVVRVNTEGGDKLKTITYIGSVAYMCASLLTKFSSFPIIIRLLRKIPDPLLGPKEVRGLLVIRGIAA
jgi:hypothetical protein